MHMIIASALTAYAAAKNSPSSDQHCMDICADASSDSTSRLTSTDETSNEVIARKRLPLKKQMVVRWKDQVTEDKHEHTVTLEVGSSKSGSNCQNKSEVPIHEISTKPIQGPRKSPPPPIIDTEVLQKRIAKQERAIRNACKLELKLLNEAKQVRDKRSKMVERLQKMKRKARRLIVINAQNTGDILGEVTVVPFNKINMVEDNFVLPPVWGEKAKPTSCSKIETSSPSSYVDMTAQDEINVQKPSATSRVSKP